MSKTFIKAAEVWTSSDDGTLLEFGAGAFGPARRMDAISRSMCFGRGEGLPGRAWDEGHPLLLAGFTAQNFQRTAAAQAGELDCAIALPQFTPDGRAVVLVIFCGHAEAAPAALELWRHVPPPGGGTDMTLVDGAYGPRGAEFAATSQRIHMQRGEGLPGAAWERGQSVFMEELSADPTRFLRAEQASLLGLQRGLALPVAAADQSIHVVSFLAGPELPLAQRIERWAADDTKTKLLRVDAFSELHGGRSSLTAELPLLPPTGAPVGSIVEAWTRQVPAINNQPATEPGAPARAASSIGAFALLAIPVRKHGVVTEVLALYL